jgi:hypothetical protein
MWFARATTRYAVEGALRRGHREEANRRRLRCCARGSLRYEQPLRSAKAPLPPVKNKVTRFEKL